jgi:hypothetical protein
MAVSSTSKPLPAGRCSRPTRANRRRMVPPRRLARVAPPGQPGNAVRDHHPTDLSPSRLAPVPGPGRRGWRAGQPGGACPARCPPNGTTSSLPGSSFRRPLPAPSRSETSIQRTPPVHPLGSPKARRTTNRPKATNSTSPSGPTRPTVPRPNRLPSWAAFGGKQSPPKKRKGRGRSGFQARVLSFSKLRLRDLARRDESGSGIDPHASLRFSGASG